MTARALTLKAGCWFSNEVLDMGRDRGDITMLTTKDFQHAKQI